MKQNYWKNFWNENPIIHKENPQQQVGRTINGKPISDELWKQTLMFLAHQLQLNSQDILLDIAAGSGMISIPFSQQVKEVVALDISEKLLENIHEKNIQTLVADAREVVFQPEKFTKVILYFALQHFSWEECVQLFKNIYHFTAKNGIVYIGDIPNINQLFDFHNTNDWKNAYFMSLENNQPIIGTWFTEDFLLNLAKFCGFSSAEIITQPKEFINAHYRFDLKLVK